MFFKRNNDIKIGKAKDYLKECQRFESYLLPIFHLLMGASSRGTDFENLTFRNGTRGILRKVELVDNNWILIEKQSRKTAFLKGKPEVYPVLIPKKYFDIALYYWIVIRPLCCILIRGLRREDELERWQRYCFIKASSKVILKQMNITLKSDIGPGATFQRLRHAAESHFRHHIMPKEYDIIRKFDFDSLFGHSYRTGLSYGVLNLIGSDKSHANTDITSIYRCMSEWIKILSLSEPDNIIENLSYAYIEGLDNDDEESNVDNEELNLGEEENNNNIEERDNIIEENNNIIEEENNIIEENDNIIEEENNIIEEENNNDSNDESNILRHADVTEEDNIEDELFE
jgi:hypothetical protein